MGDPGSHEQAFRGRLCPRQDGPIEILLRLLGTRESCEHPLWGFTHRAYEGLRDSLGLPQRPDCGSDLALKFHGGGPMCGLGPIHHPPGVHLVPGRVIDHEVVDDGLAVALPGDTGGFPGV